MSEKTVDELWVMIDEMQSDLAYYKTRCEELQQAIKDHLKLVSDAMWDLNHIEKGG